MGLKVQEVDTLLIEFRPKFISVLEEAPTILEIDEDEVFIETPVAVELPKSEESAPAEVNPEAT